MSNSDPGTTTSPLQAWLSGGGDMGRLVREKDWSKTALGAIEGWPQSLKTTLGILLHSKYPMFVFWGPSLVKIYNDAYRPITGRKHPWALGSPATEVWPEIWQDIEPLVDRALAGDPTWSDDLLLFMERNGFPEEVYFTFSYSPVSDESGGVGGMFCACTETTGQVLGERRLRTLRDVAAAPGEARSVFDACILSAQALSGNATDVPFALIYIAQSAERYRLLGQSGAIPGDDCAPLEIRVSDANAPWPLATVIESRQPQLITRVQERFPSVPSGPWPEPPDAAVVLPIVDRGLERGVGALVLGISSRRPFDDEYREFFDLIATQVGASVANARAAEEERRRTEALAEIDRAKTEFFGNVSHEFRTPLTLLLGPVEDALGGSPLQGEALESVHRNTLRLLKLVNALLDFSRIEAGRADAHYEPTDLAALTVDLASVFRTAIERAGLTLEVDSPPLDTPVFVDRDMWEKIVLNLLSNALKYTFEGAVRVSLKRIGGEAELRVEDTGIGIPAAQLPRLFERFQRVRGALGRTHEGSGIGLALVQELTKLHGGRVTVESEPGRGSTFTVSIPFGHAHLPHDRVRPTAPPPVPGAAVRVFLAEALRWLPGTQPAPFGGDERAGVVSPGRILLADDNADMRDYVTRLLQPHWRVEAVTNGEEALAAIRRERPALVLTDIMMPALDGYGLLRALRDDAALRSIPVILLSARAGEEARVEGMTAGADDYVVKPFSARELVARVSGAIDLATLRHESEERLSAINRDLRDRVNELETLLSVIPVGIGIALDRECRRIHVNPALARTLGLPEGANASLTAPEGERPTAFKVVDSDGREVDGRDLPLQVAAREGREIRDIEVDIVHSDGRVVRLLEYAVPLLDEQQQPRGSIGAFVDITERRRAEHALRESEERFRVLADDSPMFIWMADAEANVSYVNKALLRYIGLDSTEQYTGLVWERVVHPDDVPLVRAAYERAVAEREPYSLEIRQRDAAGQYRWHLIKGVPRYIEGRFVGMMGTGLDIHDQRVAVDALTAVEASLRQTNRLKDEFLATLSHELRTPLNAVLGWTHMIRTGTLRDDLRTRAFESLERNARAQAQLVDDLLDVSRIISGKLEIRNDQVMLQHVVALAMETVQPTAINKGVTLQFVTDEAEPLVVRGDADRLRQVAWNLLSNAIKFTPPGGTVDVTLSRRADVAELVVRDSGQGIDASFLPFVFDRFRQGDGSMTRRHGGLGLGLAIVRHLIEAHGGTVSASSDGPGHGATFVVHLPLTSPAARLEHIGATASAAVGPSLAGVTVLIVDDEVDARELLQVCLESAGAQVTLCESAGEALQHLQRQRFDVLLADIGMPKQDGLSLIRAIRDLEEPRNRIPAVAVTAYASQRERQQILEAGYGWHLAKPVNLAELVATVRAASSL